MAYGPDEDDNAIHDEMLLRFKSISCVRLPTVELEEGESFGYPAWQRYQRFLEGLMIEPEPWIRQQPDPDPAATGSRSGCCRI